MFIALHAHPLFYGVIGMIIGIVSAAYAANFFLVALFLGCLLLIGTQVFHRLLIIIAIGVVLGLFRFELTSYTFKKAMQEIVHATNQLPADCSAKVIDYAYKDNGYHRHHLTLQLYKINNYPVRWTRLYTVVLHAVSNFESKIGDYISLNQVRFSYSKDAIYKNWLLKNGSIAHSYHYSFESILVNRPSLSIRRFIFEQRARLWLKIKRSMPLKTYTLLASLFGGSKEVHKEFMHRNKILFKRWGIAHQLARSGMHVSFFISLWMMVLCSIPLGLVLRSWCIIVLILMYALLSWPSISFNRALIMALIDQLLRIMGKQKNSLHVWSLTTFLVLLYNPLYVFFIDFQLSFGFSLLLIWMAQLNYLEKRGL